MNTRSSRSGFAAPAPAPAGGGKAETGVRSGRGRSAGLLLVICLLGTGLVWDIVQIGAWAGMWVQNVRTESFAGSVATTFSEEGMCALCHAVREAKGVKGGSGDEAVTFVNRFLLLVPVHAVPRLVFVPERGSAFVLERTSAPEEVRSDPPVPPPRAVRFACAIN